VTAAKQHATGGVLNPWRKNVKHIRAFLPGVKAKGHVPEVVDRHQ
jgi:hypothetical protein